MKIFSIRILLTLILLFTQNILGQSGNRFLICCNYNYGENISASDKKSLVSLVQKELRALGDIKLISQGEYEKTIGAFRLDINLMQIDDKKSERLGYVTFTIYLRKSFFETDLNTYLGKYYAIQNDFRTGISSMVAHFNKIILKPLR
jgi:hypothetical protein